MDERATMSFRHTVHPSVRPAHVSRTDRLLRLISRLHDDYLAEYDDDLNAVLGAGPEGIAGSRRTPGLMRRQPDTPTAQGPDAGSERVLRAQRLDRLLGQAVNMARAAARRCPSSEFAGAIDRADKLRTGPTAAASADEAHIRRMAMAAQDLLDRLDPGDAAAPLPTFDLLPRGLWCA
ncbi:hypothetical protein ACGH2B_24830 [Streptomyces sp. BBFR2]|uniref:hypothetical protein n=1 Tax=Streptomyces sp. BBFR2 TaxID=3372854 RepID=UPI0037D99FD6